MTTSKTHFTGKILEFLGRHALTSPELAAMAGVDEKTLGNWISGRHKPSDKLGEKVENFMEIYDNDHQDCQQDIFSGAKPIEPTAPLGGSEVLTFEEQCYVIASVMCSQSIPAEWKASIVRRLFPNFK